MSTSSPRAHTLKQIFDKTGQLDFYDVFNTSCGR